MVGVKKSIVVATARKDRVDETNIDENGIKARV